ncbi:putative nucleotidyltransferase [Desulfitispora alkaliphila]|uniref:nucleotidyltransferase domain-containing protein n=1 Tax=Desulfitispora alkaliphila TaxID=622674 RepID=UPI003D24CB87
MKDPVIEKVKEIAAKYKVKKAVLFGSRSRGDHSPISDYDIAIIDTLPVEKEARIYHEVEEIDTLKKLDLAFIKEEDRDEFSTRIKKDGVVIYECTR